MSQSVQVKPAAAVILVRAEPPSQGGFSVYLQQRAGSMAFMANRFVFPGGKVEPGDGEDPMSPESLAICALRELWEEAGVLLALPVERAADLDPRRVDGLKDRVAAGELGLKAAWNELELSPDLRSLTVLARWITPPERSWRFDTTFFLANMPAGQTPVGDRRETRGGLWLTPASALAENAAGRVGLAPPQVRLLGELAACPDLEAVGRMASAADQRPIMPRLYKAGGRRVVLLPDDPDYEAGGKLDPDRLGQPCSAGRATRLVDQDDLWLPYRAD